MSETCPYCKIDFDAEPWARPTKRTLCRNCRYYHEASVQQDRERREVELFERYKVLPLQWWELPQYSR